MQRLETIKANCDACESKESLLDTAYETASSAHQTVTTMTGLIDAVVNKQLAYDQAMGVESNDNGFNRALQNLKDVINPLQNSVNSHARTDANVSLPSGLAELFLSVNTNAMIASARHEDVNKAKQSSIDSGLCQPSAGGANEECTQSHLDHAKLAAIDADQDVNTAKVQA